MLRSVNLKTLNPHITCVLCGGYLVDATTIIECLHSFCRNCIVRYLETSFHCPVCDVEIHKTKPLLHIRPDRVLQDIVYKLVPGLCHEEHKVRREMEENLNQKPLQETQPEGPSKDDTSEDKSKQDDCPDIDDPICISLEYYGRKRYLRTAEQIFPTRYLRCSSKVTVGVLKKFLSLKFGIPPTHQSELVRSDEILDNHVTMRELSRIYGLYTKSYLDLQYIFLSSKEDDELKSEFEGAKKIDYLHQNVIQVKRKRRRRRKQQSTTEQQQQQQQPQQRQQQQPQQQQQPKRRRMGATDARTNIDYQPQREKQELAQPEQHFELSTQQELQPEQCSELSQRTHTRVPLDDAAQEHETKPYYNSVSVIKHGLVVHDQVEPERLHEQYQEHEPVKQETISKVVQDNEAQNQLHGRQQFKENEKTISNSQYENLINHQLRAFASTVRQTEGDVKESIELFKIPSLPPLRSRNLETQVINFNDTFS